MRKLLPLLFLYLMLPTLVSSSQKSEKHFYREVLSENKELALKVDSLIAERDSLRQELLRPSMFALKYGVNATIHFELANALNTLPFEYRDLVITSITRRGDKRSKHRSGRAVDIRYDECFINWLASEEGAFWLDAHGLDVLIEFSPYRRDSRDYYQFKKMNYDLPMKRWRRASGKHIHLELSRKSKRVC